MKYYWMCSFPGNSIWYRRWALDARSAAIDLVSNYLPNICGDIEVLVAEQRTDHFCKIVVHASHTYTIEREVV